MAERDESFRITDRVAVVSNRLREPHEEVQSRHVQDDPTFEPCGARPRPPQRGDNQQRHERQQRPQRDVPARSLTADASRPPARSRQVSAEAS